jgi:8-oxo-dGTP pyrophosphatase MutT (NUDIX family)
MSASSPKSRTTKKPANLQYAALPYRVRDGAVEILLVTTKYTRRWIIPKGWPIAERPPHISAAQEAREEAGVEGDIEKSPLGAFHYFKQRKNGNAVRCKVEVFALRVTDHRQEWPDKKSRELRWCSIADAAAAVGEPELRRLILAFDETKHR